MSIWDKIAKLELIVGSAAARSATTAPGPKRRELNPHEQARADRGMAASDDYMQAIIAAMKREADEEAQFGKRARTITQLVMDDREVAAAYDRFLWATGNGADGEPYRPIVNGRMVRP